MGSKYQTRYDGTLGPNTFRADDRLDNIQIKTYVYFQQIQQRQQLQPLVRIFSHHQK